MKSFFSALKKEGKGKLYTFDITSSVYQAYVLYTGDLLSLSLLSQWLLVFIQLPPLLSARNVM